MNTDNKTKELELLNYLENTPTADILRDLTNGKKPIPVDVKLAEQLMSTYGMPLGVVNVLFMYVYIRYDHTINNAYIERIASHWISKKIATTKEALKISRDESRKYNKWKKEGEQFRKEVHDTKVIEARQKAIEIAVYDSSMSDEQLGKFIRKMFLTN